MLKKIIIVCSILLVSAVFYSCGDRGTNITEPNYNIRNANEAIWITDHVFSDELALSMFKSVSGNSKMFFTPYTPPGYRHPGFGRRYPVLYLLAPFGGTQRYYFSRGLVAIADKLIAEGEIEPMIIVCIDGSPGYGGTFYGDSWGGGRYAKIIGDIEGSSVNGTLIDYIDKKFCTDTASTGRAISGFGVGGYGALRIAIRYSENFSAVSAVSAPLDINGAGGNTGFVPIFKQIISDRLADLTQIDYFVYKPIPARPAMPGHVQSFVPNVSKTLDTLSLFLSAKESQSDTVVVAIYSNFPGDASVLPVGADTLVIDASSAEWFNFVFEPAVNIIKGQEYFLAAGVLDSAENARWHYSQIDRYGFGEAWFSTDNYHFERYPQGDFVFDFGEEINVLSDVQYKTLDSSDHDALALIIAAACNFTPYIDYDSLLYIIPGNEPTPVAGDTFYFADTTTLLNPEGGIEFLLPFDSAGSVYDTVWNIWLANNIDSFLSIYPGALDSMYMRLFLAGDEGFGFNQQTLDFATSIENYLAGRGINKDITPLQFDGYGDYPGTIDRFTYDILPAILKFHSRYFEIP